MTRFLAMTIDQRWLDTTPEQLAEIVLEYSRERFGMLLDDIRSLVQAGPVVAEGFQILPASVAPVLDDSPRAIFLVPTDVFRTWAVGRRGRGTAWAEMSDPERAHANRLARDRLIDDRSRAEAEETGLEVLEVAGQPLADVTAAVEREFASFLTR